MVLFFFEAPFCSLSKIPFFFLFLTISNMEDKIKAAGQKCDDFLAQVISPSRTKLAFLIKSKKKKKS
jgi:hypothetical protein